MIKLPISWTHVVFIKKKTPKNKSQRCWRGVGGGWISVTEWYYKNASSRTYATTWFTLD